MYHRVAALPVDPWQLAITPEHFEQHLELLLRKFKVLSLTEFINQLNSNFISPGTVCLTFDDGYLDNYLIAKPLLEKYDCPATFFIASSFVQKQQPFWWDELQQLILETDQLPEICSFIISGNKFHFDLKEESILKRKQKRQIQSWFWPSPPPNLRCALYLKLWQILKPLSYAEIQTVMDNIKCWSQTLLAISPETFPMNIEQLRDLAAQPLFQLGLHTANHSALPSFTRDTQQQEIIVNKEYLEKITTYPVTTMSYPYGEHNENTLAVVNALQLHAGFTTAEQCIQLPFKKYSLSRFQVKNWNAKQLERKMDHWLFDN
jgi:peptidoglycan/xylan/chitin deacetylase (PgdA/CDA1 family)